MQFRFFYRWNPETKRWVEVDEGTYQYLRMVTPAVVMASLNKINR
jgi:hypothetical protein